MQHKLEEVQKSDNIWPLSIMAVTLVGNWLLYFKLGHNDLAFFYISIACVGLLCLFLSSLKLTTEFTASSFRYKMFPYHLKWKEISSSEIQNVEVRDFKPFQEYGGWGNRRGKSGRSYTIKGKVGIQFLMKDGQKILFGTQQKVAVGSFLKEKFKVKS